MILKTALNHWNKLIIKRAQGVMPRALIFLFIINIRLSCSVSLCHWSNCHSIGAIHPPEIIPISSSPKIINDSGKICSSIITKIANFIIRKIRAPIMILHCFRATGRDEFLNIITQLGFGPKTTSGNENRIPISFTGE